MLLLYFPEAHKTTPSNMRSTYFLIEQSELHTFLRELDALHSWARNMAGLSTSITAQVPLEIPAARPGPRFYGIERPRRPDPFAASAWYTPSEDEYHAAPPAPRPQHFQHHQNLNQPFGGMGQGYGGFEYRERGHMGYDFGPPSPGLGRRGASSTGMCRDQSRGEARAKAAWSVPMQSGPHRTPVITRAPNNPHTPQRGAMFVRRPRRARPQRNAENAEVMGDGTEEEEEEEEEYVEQEHQEVDHEGEAPGGDFVPQS